MESDLTIAVKEIAAEVSGTIRGLEKTSVSVANLRFAIAEATEILNENLVRISDTLDEMLMLYRKTSVK